MQIPCCLCPFHPSLTFLVGALQFLPVALPVFSTPSPIPSLSHLPPRKPVLHAESVTCLHTHCISLKGYLELLSPPLPPLLCHAKRHQGAGKKQPAMVEDRMSGCSWTAIVVAPGDRVQGKLRTFLIRTQGNHKPHSPTQNCILSPPTQLRWSGKAGLTTPSLVLPRTGTFPLTVRPRTYSKGQASSGHHSVGRPGIGWPSWCCPWHSHCCTFLGCFKETQEGCHSGLGWLPILHQRGAISPATPSVPQPPPPPHTPTLLQAKAWPGFYLPV